MTFQTGSEKHLKRLGTMPVNSSGA